ncbi:MAG: hypothetical protein HQ478_09245 [Chloroflexi bacterium]|nr:hypothetical protein [Chloroflexota bacterium]
MLNGVLVATGLVLVSLLTIGVPIVHFISVPLGPFVAGLIGGGVAKADEGQIVKFGLYVGALMAIPAGITIGVGFLVDFGDPWSILLPVLGIAIVPYTWWAVTIGALGSYLMRRGEAKREAENQISK